MIKLLFMCSGIALSLFLDLAGQTKESIIVENFVLFLLVIQAWSDRNAK